MRAQSSVIIKAQLSTLGHSCQYKGITVNMNVHLLMWGHNYQHKGTTVNIQIQLTNNMRALYSCQHEGTAFNMRIQLLTSGYISTWKYSCQCENMVITWDYNIDMRGTIVLLQTFINLWKMLSKQKFGELSGYWPMFLVNFELP